jgi:hypothetical protein
MGYKLSKTIGLGESLNGKEFLRFCAILVFSLFLKFQFGFPLLCGGIFSKPAY